MIYRKQRSARRDTSDEAAGLPIGIDRTVGCWMLAAACLVAAGCSQGGLPGRADAAGTQSGQNDADPFASEETIDDRDAGDARNSGTDGTAETPDSAGDACSKTCDSPAHARAAGCADVGCRFECNGGWKDENGDLQDPGGDGCETEVCTPSNGGTEICDGADNDCDGDVDERGLLLHEGFEGDDALASQVDWAKNAPREFLNVDSDIEDTMAPEGQEHARAHYKHGSCEIPAGIAGGKQFEAEIDEIRVQVDVEIEAWGRAAIWVLDKTPRNPEDNLVRVWSVNAKGNGYSTDGWKTLAFDTSAQEDRTTESGAIIKRQPLPEGLGGNEVIFIFGNNDDSQHCEVGDHGWSHRVDDLRAIERCD